MKKFRTVWGIAAALIGVALLAGSVTTASNMGFKFVPNVPNTAGNNSFNLALPWNNNYTNSENFQADLGPALERVAKVQGNTKLLSWFGNGEGGGSFFNLTKGEAYLIFSKTGQTLQPVIVGSHDPSFTFSFTANQAFNAAAPYHQTLTNSEQLISDLRTQLSGGITRVAQIQANTKLLSWFGNGQGGGNFFQLDLGKGVLIFPSANKSGYVWPHY